jgi:hypothetical protein
MTGELIIVSLICIILVSLILTAMFAECISMCKGWISDHYSYLIIIVILLLGVIVICGMSVSVTPEDIIIDSNISKSTINDGGVPDYSNLNNCTNPSYIPNMFAHVWYSYGI